MYAIEFQTTVKNIITAIPKKRRSELLGHTEDLYTEDMHNGLIVADKLTIVNPFTSLQN
ncbi:MAG: PIN domain-containing protein [Chloroflexi bacterium]|nr:PIN domain-containing protein [Chloroflexota bacterium]